MEPEYLDKVHGIMQGVYGDKFTLDVDTFKDKMINETQYRDKIYGIMQGVYGDKFTLDPKTFYNKVLESSKKKSQSEIGSQATQPGDGSENAQFLPQGLRPEDQQFQEEQQVSEKPKRVIYRGEGTREALETQFAPEVKKETRKATVVEATKPVSLESKYKNVEKLETVNDKVIETFQSENRTRNFTPKDIENNYNEYAKNALDDYLDYLNFVDRGGSQYQKTKEKLEYYRSLGDKLFNDENYADEYKNYVNLQKEAILNVNKQDAKYVNRLKDKYDWGTFNKKTSEVELKLSDIEGQIKKISSDGGPLTPLQQKKYDDLLSQYNQIQTDYSKFSNELGITEDVLNQMSNSASRLSASQKAFNNIEDEDTVNSNRLKEYKNQLLSNKKAQEEFYGDKDQAWYEQFGKGVLVAGQQLGSSLIKGSISMVGDVPQLLTDAIGIEGYGVTDRVAEAADNINSYVDLIAPQLEDQDFPGFVKASSVIGNGLGSIGTFMLAGGGATKAAQGILKTSTKKGLQIANKVGVFTAASSLSSGQLYDQLIEEGFNPTEASRYALAGGVVMGAAEMLVPEDELLSNSVRRTFIGALKNKNTVKEATEEALKFVYNRTSDITKTSLKEGGEEAIGQFAQDLSLQAASSISGKEIDGLWEVQPYVDNFLAGGGVGGVIELLKFGTRNSKYGNKFKESLLNELAENYDDISNKMAQIKPGEFDKIGEKYAKLKNVNNALKDIPGFENLSHADKSHILALAYNKQVILDGVKQSGLDKSNFESELNDIEAEIQKTLNKPKENAVQERSTEEVLPREQGETTETGGQPQGMGQGVQGQEVAQQGETEAQRQERIAKEASAGAAEVVTELNMPNALAASVFPVVGEVEAQIEKGEFVNDEKSTEAQDKLYELLADIDSREDLTPEQKQQMSAVIENRIQKIQDYDYRTRTETRTTTQTVATGVSPKTQKQNQRAAIPVRTVAEEGIEVTYDGRRGKVELRNGQYVFIPAKTGAVQGRPVVIGEAAQVNSGSRFAGVENPTKGPNAVVANITLPNGSTLSVLNDDLSVDIGIEIAKQEVGAAPQALFDTVFEEVVTENKVEVPYLRETKPAQEQAATTEQPAPQVTPQVTPQVQEEKQPYTGGSNQDRKLKEKYKVDNLKRKILDQARRISSALGNNTKVYIYETTDEYNAAIAERLGEEQKESTNGRFLYGDGVSEIHIDLSKANDRTLPHEAVHAVLYKAFGENEKLFQKFKDKLKPLLDNSTVAELEKFANQETYVRQGVTAEEFLGELGGAMTAAGNRIPKSTLQKITQLLNEFLSKITGGRINPLSTGEVIDLFNSMADAFASGKTITNLTKAEKALRDGSISSKAQTVSIAKGKETAKKLGLSEKYNNVRQIAEALEERQRKKYGKIDKNDFSEEALSKISKWMVDEVEFFVDLMGDKSGKGWYGELFQQGIDNMSSIFPELKSDQNARDLFTMLVAITSDGEKVKSNFRLASLAYNYYRKNGKLPTNLKASRPDSINGNMKKLNKLLKQFNNVSKLKDNLLNVKSISELNKERKLQGLKALTSSWPVVFKAPFSASVFGPKLGMFYANLSGQENYPTLDRWWSRTFNRYRGTLIPQLLRGFNTKNQPIGLDRFKDLAGNSKMSDDQALILINENRNNYKNKGYKNGSELEKAANTLFKQINENINDAPFNKSDREFMYDAFVKTSKLLKRKGYDLSIADIQAILWYYEKFLYKTLGAKGKIDGVSYGDVANFIVEKYKENGNSFGYDINPDEDIENIEEEEDIEMEDSVSEEKTSKLKSKSQVTNLVEKAGISSNMTEDDQGNYLFYHYSPNKISSIDPRFFGRNVNRTGRDERPGMNISMYYTSPDVKDVSGDFGYVVRIPKDKVYPFNKDPLDLYDKAKEAFNKKFPGQAFDPNKQVAFISAEAAKLGYPMTVAKWGDNLRAQTTQKMVGEVYTKPAKDGGIDVNEDIAQFKVNKKARRSKLKSKSQIEVNPQEIQSNSEAKLNEVVNGDPEGGATFNLDGTTYDGGGLVIPITSVNIDTDKISTKDISDMVEDNIDKIFDDQKVKTGIYKFTDGKQMSVDLNIIVPSEKVEFAKEFARAAGQESIFSLDTYENIKTGSTGENPVSFSADEFLEIAEALNEGRLPNIERLEYNPEIKSKSQVSAIPSSKAEQKEVISEMETAMSKTGLAKENAVKRFIEKYGEKGVVAKQISDNFDKIQEQLGITKICNI